MITGYSSVRIGNIITVTATSDLSGVIYYHWYLDGSWIGQTNSNEKTITLGLGEQAELLAIDTNDADYDYIANAPVGWPSRHTVTWLRSLDDDVVQYVVEQRQDGGDWEEIATVDARSGRWSYDVTTPVLVDLSTYDWQITPVDEYGNSGTAEVTDAVLVVHGHNALAFTATLELDTTVTIEVV